MRSKLGLTILSLALLTCVSCTTQGAAGLGVAIGQAMGTPMGVAATAFDETFQVAGDVVDANPRYAKRTAVQRSQDNSNRQSRPAVRSEPSRTNQGRTTHSEPATHYYRAEVLVKTRGPAAIESIDFADSMEEVDFWN